MGFIGSQTESPLRPERRGQWPRGAEPPGRPLEVVVSTVVTGGTRTCILPVLVAITGMTSVWLKGQASVCSAAILEGGSVL